MSTKDYSAEFLKMEGVQIEKLDETEEEIFLQISMERKMHICKRCGGKTDRITITAFERCAIWSCAESPCGCCTVGGDTPARPAGSAFRKPTILSGAICALPIAPPKKIMELLRRRSSMKDIAKDTGTSVSGVKRVLGIMPVSRPQRLPQALSFDEFKGDTGGQPFQCIVADPLNRCVFDILPDRTALTIQEYLRSFPNRDEVKYVVMDMNRGFRNIARTFPAQRPNHYRPVPCGAMLYGGHGERPALLPVFPSQGTEALLQALQAVAARHRDRLSDEDCAAVDVMLRFSDRLLQAYALKEAFYHFMDAPTARPLCGVLDFWLDACDRLELPNSNPAARRCSTGSPTYSTLSIFACPMGLPRVATTQSRHSKSRLRVQKLRSFRARILLSLGPYPNI